MSHRRCGRCGKVRPIDAVSQANIGLGGLPIGLHLTLQPAQLPFVKGKRDQAGKHLVQTLGRADE